MTRSQRCEPPRHRDVNTIMRTTTGHRGAIADKGFTLVELLIVIVVLGILSGIVVFGVGRFRGDAEAAACKADVATVSTAAEAYNLTIGTYPTTLDQLLTGNYLKTTPADGAYSFDPTAKITVREPECADAVGAPATAARRITGIGGACLDLANGSADTGTAVQLGTCDRRPSQRWAAPATWPGEITVLGKCLDVSGGDTANLTRVHLWDCNSTGAQVWDLQADGTLRNPQSGRCLDAGNDPPAGTQLYIWDCHAQANQRWVFLSP